MTVFRFIRPVHPVSIKLADAQVRHIAMPHEPGTFGHFYNVLLPRVIIREKAKLNSRGVFRVNREINAGSIPGGTLRIRRPGQYFSSHDRSYRQKSAPVFTTGYGYKPKM